MWEEPEWLHVVVWRRRCMWVVKGTTRDYRPAAHMLGNQWYHLS